MSFFESDLVNSEINEINRIQEEINKNLFKFSDMTKEEKLHHMDLLQKLVDLQKIFYMRLSLSDDADAKNMKEKIIETVTEAGLSSDININLVLNDMSNLIVDLKERIDKNPSNP